MYHIASTPRWSASTLESSSFDPVTMLITPAGTSEVSSTLYSSVAATGWASDGIATTVFPTATAGATSETNPSSGSSSGAATPTTPIGSFLASVTPRIVVGWTWPSYLSAQEAYVKSRETAASTSARARSGPQPVMASMRAANSSVRVARFSAM